jgi:hypothetical protein
LNASRAHLPECHIRNIQSANVLGLVLLVVEVARVAGRSRAALEALRKLMQSLDEVFVTDIQDGLGLAL